MQLIPSRDTRQDGFVPKADEVTQILQPGQHTVFQRVGKRNRVIPLAGLVHVRMMARDLLQLPFCEDWVSEGVATRVFRK